jgi:hypothetical protein
LVLALALSACGGASPGGTSGDPQEAQATEAVMEEKMAETEMAGMPEAGADRAMPAAETPLDDSMSAEMPGWLSLPLADARTGEAFTMADYNGKVVLVETMAIWCTKCLQQQMQVVELHSLLGEREDFISVGLDVDPNEDSPALKAYTEERGFDWVYAVAPPELSNALADQYGANFLNPPSTPMLIIDRHGAVHPLPFGIKSAAELQAALEPFLSEGM